jgi:hypothetical protein
MEVAFQAKLKSNEDGEVVLDDEWFSKRVEDCMLVLVVSTPTVSMIGYIIGLHGQH